MSERAALVTGASRGIGLALAETLGEEGFALTLTARKPESLEETAQSLREKGYEVQQLAANMADEDGIREVIKLHRDHFGRLDVLVNSAGVGIGAAAGEHQTKYVDMQLNVNVRAIVVFYRECLEMLRAAGAEHRNALVVNMASLGGKTPEPWLSVYSAAKAAVVAYTVAMNKELNKEGIKSVAFCPGFVDTDMAEWVKDRIPADEMLRPDDIAQALRFLLHVSPACVVPEIIFQRPGEAL
ncbi:MAG: SDR family oxidoreductase [Solirubrobacterales bacterium]|nr:SDR family oxidoreductase [Solirubrobacterales bacterium]MBV9047268.1 SDR family oxidoreductase [Solirubrobacterales bacterium]